MADDTDGWLGKLAGVLVRHSTAVRVGDLVTIVGEPCLLPAVEALYAAVLAAGGHPSFYPRSEALQRVALEHAGEEQLRHVCPFEQHRLATCDVLIVLRHPLNTRFLDGIDSKKIALAQAARRGLLKMSLDRLASGAQRYVLAEIPGPAAAHDAGMPPDVYAGWVRRAGFLHLPDPAAAWGALRERQERACVHLRGKSELRFRAPPADGVGGGRRHDGTDLTVDVSGRAWVNGAGEQNFPDGEIFTGPRGVDGVVNYSFPMVHQGKEVDGVRLEFRGGRVVGASAARNEEHLVAMLDQDEGARTAGELGLGTNYELKETTKSAFFDEKIGGTFHVALGAGYPQTGNTNESALHWDMVCDLRAGGAMYADGELIQQNGRFLPEGWPRR